MDESTTSTRVTRSRSAKMRLDAREQVSRPLLPMVEPAPRVTRVDRGTLVEQHEPVRHFAGETGDFPGCGRVIMYTDQVGVIVQWRGHLGKTSYVYSPVSGFVKIPPLDGVLGLDYREAGFGANDLLLANHQTPCDWMSTGCFVYYDCYSLTADDWYAIRLKKYEGQPAGILSPPIVRGRVPLKFTLRCYMMSQREYRGKTVLLLWNNAIGRISLDDDSSLNLSAFEVVECMVSFVPLEDRMAEDIPWKAIGKAKKTTVRSRERPLVRSGGPRGAWSFSCDSLCTSDGWQIRDDSDRDRVIFKRSFDGLETFACEDDIACDADMAQYVNFRHFRITWVKQRGDGVLFNLALLVTPISEEYREPIHAHPVFYRCTYSRDAFLAQEGTL